MQLSIPGSHSLILIAAAFGFATAPVALATSALAATAGPPVKPWVKHEELECDWWLSRDDGKSHRASIGRGDSGELVLSLSDPAFTRWSDEENHAVELVFDGDHRRTVKALGWVSKGLGGDYAMLGVALDRAGARNMAGAKKVEVRRDGKPVMLLLLAGTPSRSVLEKCIPVYSGKGCSE